MKHAGKTKAQLITELEELRQRVGEFEESETELKRAERTLQKDEERFRSLVETTTDWFWEVDENTFYTYSSPKIRDLLGYESEEVLGQTPFAFMTPEEADRVVHIFASNAKSRRPFELLENTNIHKDGHPVVLETSGIPIFDVNGVFRGYRGIDRDITERKRAEEELRKAHDEMEKKVEERTKELLESNEQLRREIENRERVENRLRKSEKELREHTEALEEANIALRVLLSHRDEEKKRLEDTVLSSLQKLITPYLQRLKETTLSTEQQAYVDILETNLYEVASPFTDKLSSKCPGITPRELEIAGLIKAGKTNVEIADLLGITESAISFHRKNLRSKLGLKHKKVNLRSYLLSLV
jgi:PAS domain S-box-containing protein